MGAREGHEAAFVHALCALDPRRITGERYVLSTPSRLYATHGRHQSVIFHGGETRMKHSLAHSPAPTPPPRPLPPSVIWQVPLGLPQRRPRRRGHDAVPPGACREGMLRAGHTPFGQEATPVPRCPFAYDAGGPFPRGDLLSPTCGQLNPRNQAIKPVATNTARPERTRIDILLGVLL